jgi:hypothetical protein
MTNAKPCMFCFAERAGHIKRSSEHFVSRPVAAAFGIDRDGGEVYRFSEGGADLKVARLNGLKRRCVCRDCNSGWMNQLEHSMAKVAEWFDAEDGELGDDLDLALRKWSLTRHLLLTEMDGNAAEFAAVDDLVEEYVVPPVSLARALYENDVDTIRGAAIAIGRSSADVEFAWAFGHPTVIPQDRPQLGRFAATSVLTMRGMQVWTTTPMIFDYEVYLPVGLAACGPNLRSRDLPPRSGLPSAKDATVRFLDVEETSAVINQISQLSEHELRDLARSAEDVRD